MTKEILKVALLFLSMDGILGMKCYEGFNVSLADLPFYHWAERQCESGSECIIQDVVVNESSLGVSVRYGGCIKHSHSPLLKCSQLFGEENTATVEEYFNLMLGIDKKIKDFIGDFLSDPATHIRLLFSRGGHGKNEFREGIHRFLTNLGFDGKRIKKPLENFLAEFERKRYGASLTFDNLINSMKVTNEETKRLSDALSEFLDILYPNMPSESKSWIVALPGIFYPVVSLSGYNVSNEVYEDLSKGFEFVNDGSKTVLSEEKMVNFLLHLTFLQQFIGDFYLENKKTMYDFNIKTFQMYETAYPESFVIKGFLKRADILYKYGKLTDLLYPCSTFSECMQKHSDGLAQMQVLRTKEDMNALFYLASQIDQTDSPVDTVFEDNTLESDIEELVQAYSTLMEISLLKPSGLSFRALAQHMHRPVINIANKMRDDAKKKLRRLFTPHSCKDYLCGSDLCNRHKAIEVQKPMLMSQSEDPGHNEL